MMGCMLTYKNKEKKQNVGILVRKILIGIQKKRLVQDATNLE